MCGLAGWVGFTTPEPAAQPAHLRAQFFLTNPTRETEPTQPAAAGWFGSCGLAGQRSSLLTPNYS